MLFCKYKVFAVFLEEHILLAIFLSYWLIVAYPLNENKPQLLVTFENWGWEVAKQLLHFFGRFWDWPVSNLGDYKKKVYKDIVVWCHWKRFALLLVLFYSSYLSYWLPSGDFWSFKLYSTLFYSLLRPLPGLFSYIHPVNTKVRRFASNLHFSKWKNDSVYIMMHTNLITI